MIRQYIAYFVLIMFLVVAGMAATFWVSTKQLQAQLAIRDTQYDRLKDQQTSLADAYQNQSKAVDTIRQSMEITDSLITNLSLAVNHVKANSAEVKNRIETLEKTNVAFREYLSAHLPDDGCVLDNTCPGANYPGKNGNGTPKSGAPAAVPGAGNKTKPVK